MRKQKKTSFTLIEMLVVMGIIGVLTSLLMPSLRSVSSNAESMTCLNNMRQINSISNVYSLDWNDARHMAAEPSVVNYSNHTATGWNMWFKFLEEQYVKPYDQMFNCPSSPISYGPNLDLAWKYRDRNSYGYNFTVLGNHYSWNWYFVRGDAQYKTKRVFSHQVRSPSKQIAYGDMGGAERSPEVGWWRHHLLLNKMALEDITPVARHSKGSFNIGYLDGHVENQFPEDVLPSSSSTNEHYDEYWNLLDE